MAFWDNLLAPFGTDAQEKAAQAQQDAARAAYAQYSGLAEQGRNALTSNFQAGLAPVMGNVAATQAGQDQLLRALGIPVPGETQPTDMTALLRATPGYQFTRDQGLEAVLRNAAKSGSLASGGTNIDLLNYGTGLADQTYQNYVKNLSQFPQAAGTAAGQALTGYGNLGSGLASSFQNQGNAAYGMNTAIGNAQASADLAPLTAGSNIWNLGLGLGKLAMGGLGMGGGASAAGGALGDFTKGLFGSFANIPQGGLPTIG